jgi:hypothetical protein
MFENNFFEKNHVLGDQRHKLPWGTIMFLRKKGA